MKLVKQSNNLYMVTDNDGVYYENIIAKKHTYLDVMKNEVDRLNKVKHLDGVAKIITTKNNIIFLEKIVGDDLFNILMKRELYENEILLIARSLLEIIKSIHDIGVIHGDIKPENIMYNEITKKITIVDFEFGQYTYGYASPERILTDNITRAGDVWGVGATIYTLLMGYNPYNNVNHLLSGVNYHPMDDPRISILAKNFVYGTLTIDFQSRMSIVECIDHKWIKYTETLSKPSPTNSMYSPPVSPVQTPLEIENTDEENVYCCKPCCVIC